MKTLLLITSSMVPIQGVVVAVLDVLVNGKVWHETFFSGTSTQCGTGKGTTSSSTAGVNKVVGTTVSCEPKDQLAWGNASVEKVFNGIKNERHVCVGTNHLGIVPNTVNIIGHEIEKGQEGRILPGSTDGLRGWPWRVQSPRGQHQRQYESLAPIVRSLSCQQPFHHETCPRDIPNPSRHHRNRIHDRNPRKKQQRQRGLQQYWRCWKSESVWHQGR